MKKIIAALTFALLALSPSIALAQFNVTQGGTGRSSFTGGDFLYANSEAFQRITGTSSPFFTRFSFGLATGTAASTTNFFSTIGNFTNLLINGVPATTTNFWYANGTSIYNSNSGNVGIGTVSPATKLDVVGNIQLSSSGNSLRDFNGNNLIRNIAGALMVGNTAVNASSVYQTGATTDTSFNRGATTDLFIQGSTGNVGIGTTNPLYKLHVFGTTNTIGVGATSLNTAGDTAFYSSGTVTGNVNLFASDLSATGIVMASVKNTNTASANADAKLDMNVGGASAGDPYYSMTVNGVTNWTMGIDNSDSDKFKIGPVGTPSTAGNSLTINTSGNVGIGTTNPDQKLTIMPGGTTDAVSIHLADRIGQTNVNHGYVSVLDGAASPVLGDTVSLLEIASYRPDNGANRDLRFILGKTTGPFEAMRLQGSTGNVGIGTTNPSAKLDVSGAIVLSGLLNNPSSTAGGILLGGSSLQSAWSQNVFTPRAQINGTANVANASQALMFFGSGVGGPVLFTGSSRGLTVGDYTIAQNGDNLGAWIAQGANGSSMTEGGWATFVVDGTPGALNQMPTRFSVYVAPSSGAVTETARFSGTSGISLTAIGTNQNITLTPSGTGYVLTSGNMGISTTTPWAKLSVGAHNQSLATPLFVVASSSSVLATTTLFQITGNGTASTTFLRLSGTGYSTTNCLQVDTTGLVSGTGSACGAGGGGSNTDKWATSTDDSTAIYPNSAGKIGVGTTTPWALLSVASSTFNYSSPLFSIATSSDLFGRILNIFATSSVLTQKSPFSASANNSTQESGARVNIGNNKYGGFSVEPLDQLYVDGRINEGTWQSFKCYPFTNAGGVTTNPSTLCNDFKWTERSNANVTFTSQNGTPYFAMSFPAAGAVPDMSQLYVGPATPGAILDIASTTAVMETYARIGNPSLATTTNFLVGFTGIPPNSTTMTVPPTGCFFNASSTVGSTQANWWATCGNGTATTTVNTGFASSTSVTATGDFYLFRVEVGNNKADFYLGTPSITVRKVATITTNIPTGSTQLQTPQATLTRTTSLTAIPSLDVASIRLWIRMLSPLGF